MRVHDIPTHLKVRNPCQETVSLAGVITIAPGKEADVNLGALHDATRPVVYGSLVTCLRGKLLELVNNETLPPLDAVAAPPAAPKPDLEGAALAKQSQSVLEDRSPGVNTLPTVKPPAYTPAPPPADEFVPPPLPKATKAIDAVAVPAAPPAPPAPPAPAAPTTTPAHDIDV